MAGNKGNSKDFEGSVPSLKSLPGTRRARRRRKNSLERGREKTMVSRERKRVLHEKLQLLRSVTNSQAVVPPHVQKSSYFFALFSSFSFFLLLLTLSLSYSRFIPQNLKELRSALTPIFFDS